MICHCGHKVSWHHAKQIQKDNDGNKYVRTCYGIGCTCDKA